MLVLATGPIDLLGHTWQIHTMLGFVALTLIGAQVIQLGVFARTYARVRIGERDALLEESLGSHLTLEHGLIIGSMLALASVVGLVAVGVEWASHGFGILGRAYETALLVTGLGLGIQIVFGAFFLPSAEHAVATRCHRQHDAERMTVVEPTGYVELNKRPLGGHARLLELVGESKRVLDVGCSSGYLARPLVEHGCTVVGIEYDPDAAHAAQSVCEAVLVGDVEAMELPLKEASFDVVLCGDVIEHLRDPDAFLARMRPLLHDDGRIVLSTPNVGELGLALEPPRRALALHGQRNPRPHTSPPLHGRRTLVEALERAGFEIVVLDHTIPVPLVGYPASRAGRAHGRSPVRPQLFAYQFVAAARPR